ncbi:MAG: hypothetical protein KatS3mg022_2637 [Armatimonadota bacterium]|nr:MAG: hypothetical protein KatS3mg022_2637 [Armatimonadota bacterium]
MRAITIELPDEVAELLSPEERQRLALQTYVLTLVQKHRMSISRGAELLGMSLVDFAKLLGEQGGVYYDYSESDWAMEESTIAELRNQQ